MKPSKETLQNFEAKDHLRFLIKQKFAKPLDSLKSFEELSSVTELSVQTLRRFFGKIESSKNTYPYSLSLLCKYIGFLDWETFISEFNNEKGMHENDRFMINSMSIFFANGQKFNTDYFQKTSTVGTLNDYAKVIYSSKENLLYFYKKYGENNWATDYVLAWIPNYNFFGQDWFWKILADKINKTDISHVKLSQNNFLCFGAFLSENKAAFDFNYQNLALKYQQYKADFEYMSYHEMRYTTICLMNDKSNSEQIIFNYLQALRKKNYSEENYQELLIFFCNTLFWLELYTEAYAILQEAKTYLSRYNKRKDKSFLHYFGMNKAFMKVTFSLIYTANAYPNIENFEIENTDFSDEAYLLYHDYIQIMYLANCILVTNNFEKKKKIFSNLTALVDKTNYTKIYKILQNLDSRFPYQS